MEKIEEYYLSRDFLDTCFMNLITHWGDLADEHPRNNIAYYSYRFRVTCNKDMHQIDIFGDFYTNDFYVIYTIFWSSRTSSEETEEAKPAFFRTISVPPCWDLQPQG